MNNSERNAISGRFSKVDETDQAVIVGCFGTLFANDLTPWQVEHIKGFYSLSGHDLQALPDCPAVVNRSIYNGFLSISK